MNSFVLSPFSASNFITIVRTSPPLPRIEHVDCGTCSRGTASGSSLDTRYEHADPHSPLVTCFADFHLGCLCCRSMHVYPLFPLLSRYHAFHVFLHLPHLLNMFSRAYHTCFPAFTTFFPALSTMPSRAFHTCFPALTTMLSRVYHNAFPRLPQCLPALTTRAFPRLPQCFAALTTMPSRAYHNAFPRLPHMLSRAYHTCFPAFTTCFPALITMPSRAYHTCFPALTTRAFPRLPQYFSVRTIHAFPCLPYMFSRAYGSAAFLALHWLLQFFRVYHALHVLPCFSPLFCLELCLSHSRPSDPYYAHPGWSVITGARI